MDKFKKIFILSLLAILPLFWSCRTNSAASRQKQVEKQREEKDKEVLKQYNQAVEKHMKNQTKETRKRMKKTKDKSEKSGTIKKQCFIKKWFGPKDKSCPKS